jgi:hypothetical protein
MNRFRQLLPRTGFARAALGRCTTELVMLRAVRWLKIIAVHIRVALSCFHRDAPLQFRTTIGSATYARKNQPRSVAVLAEQHRELALIFELEEVLTARCSINAPTD